MFGLTGGVHTLPTAQADKSWIVYPHVNLEENDNVEVTKALAALQPLYGKDNIEIVMVDGRRIRGVVRSMKTTQALTTPSVKIECPNGELIKIPFPNIAEIKDHNGQ